jgi:sensor c-di-GMP phosphodiesterase-like protein
VSEVLMSQVVTTDINSTVTGIQNTFVQAVPEPGTLGLLGSMLLGMGWLIRRRRNQS